MQIHVDSIKDALIGLTGKKKKYNDLLEDAFELHVNGRFSEGNAKLAKVYGVLLAREIPEFMYELALKVEEKNVPFEEYAEKFEAEISELVGKFN